MAPDKIYLQVCGDCPKVDCKNCKFEDLEDNVTWCKERIFDQDVEYIRKDALLEKIDDAIAHLSDGCLTGYYESHAYNDIRELIESM